MSKKNIPPMTDMVRQELINWINGMSEDELKIIVEEIPVEMCLERIRTELNKAAAFDKHIKTIVEEFGRG